MAIFTAINFLAMRLFSKVNAGITWWKVAIPVLTIIILFFKFHPHNFSVSSTTANGGFFHDGAKALFAAIPAAGIVFAYLGFEQADQLAGEIKNPRRNLPLAIIIATILGITIYTLLQLVFIGATPPSLLTHGFAGIPATNQIAIGPFAGLAGAVGLGVWAVYPADRRVRLAVRHRPDLPDLDLARGLRPGQEPLLPADLPVDRQPGHPVGQPDLRVPVRPDIPAAVPELALAGQPGHAGQRADVRGRAAVAGRVPWPGPGGGPAVPDTGSGSVLAPIAFIPANFLIYWTGFETVWKLGIFIVVGYVLIGITWPSTSSGRRSTGSRRPGCRST